MKTISKIVVWVMLAAILTGLCGASDFQTALADVSNYVYTTVKNPVVESIGGEWAIIGLARGKTDVPREYFDKYYANVLEYVKEHNGVLHEKKYTEYSRVILALTAIGRDPAQVGGYNMLTPLGDYEKTIWQGINGPVWALIALDSGNYEMPINKNATVQATREMYIDCILKQQLPDGGFSLTGNKSDVADPDVTGMVLQALANYQSRADVKNAIQRGTELLSKIQDSDGGYSNRNVPNSESTVQVLIGLNALKIPLTDPRFVKNGNTVLDGLMQYYVPQKGFLHTKTGDGSNQMASEQGLYALVSNDRANSQVRPSLYNMSDAVPSTGEVVKAPLEGKHKDVKKVFITAPGMSFADIAGHKNQGAIEALAIREIINGKGGGFIPNATMSRAEFATIIVKALGLAPKANTDFTDVDSRDWFAAFVGTASDYKIVSGIGKGRFNPHGTITKEEGAKMVAAAAALCGMDTVMTEGAVRDMLSQFPDYLKVQSWATQGLAFCYSQGVLPQSDILIEPRQPLKRCEIAQMVYNMLTKANLL